MRAGKWGFWFAVRVPLPASPRAFFVDVYRRKAERAACERLSRPITDTPQGGTLPLGSGTHRQPPTTLNSRVHDSKVGCRPAVSACYPARPTLI